MPLLFSYGTLQDTSVQLSTFGRLLNGQRDALTGYTPSLVPIGSAHETPIGGPTHHANATYTGRSDTSVPGTVFEVTDTELVEADKYEEPADYKRISVVLASGREAWVYIHVPRTPPPNAERLP